jgi:hypothetical protein
MMSMSFPTKIQRAQSHRYRLISDTRFLGERGRLARSFRRPAENIP